MANHSDKSVQREVNKMTNKVINPSTKGSITPASVVPEIPKTKSQITSEEISKPKTKSLPQIEPKLNKITRDINLPKSPKVTKPKGKTISKRIAKLTPEVSVEEPSYYGEIATEDVLPVDELEAPKEEPYYPTLSIINAIRDKIENLERDVDVSEIPLEARKNTLLSMFDEHVASLEGTPAMKEYLQYLEDNADLINHHLDTIKYFDSGDEESVYSVIDNEFAIIARLLVRRSLMPIESETMSYLSEYSNNY